MAGLRSRVVLITGASSALGRATALSFAKQGAKLALVEHQKIHMEEFYTPLHKNEGNSCNLHTTYKLKRISAECKNLGLESSNGSFGKKVPNNTRAATIWHQSVHILKKKQVRLMGFMMSSSKVPATFTFASTT